MVSDGGHLWKLAAAGKHATRHKTRPFTGLSFAKDMQNNANRTRLVALPCSMNLFKHQL